MSSVFPITKNYAVIDTETTGVGKKDQVIEITLLHANGDILFNTLIKPTCPIHWSAFNIHNISTKELSEKPSWKDICFDFIEAAKKVDMIYIYNKPFDIRLIDQTYQAHGLVMPEINTDCAMKIVRSWLKSQGRIEGGKVNLTHVCNILGIEHNDVSRHRALGDCILTNRVINEILRLENNLNETDSRECIQNSVIKNKPLIEMSSRLATMQQLMEMIDCSTHKGMAFKEWVSELKSNGVSLEPLYFNQLNPDFKACSYSMANMIIPASKIGKNYTPRSIIARGVIYNTIKDAPLLEQLYCESQIRLQKTYFQNFMNSDEVDANRLMNLNSLIKSTYAISKRAKKNGVSISAQYASMPEMENPYTQLKLDLIEPKGILLRTLNINKRVTITPSYTSRHSTVPDEVTVTIDATVNNYVGPGCMSRAVQSLSNAEFYAAKAFFTNKTDSEILTVKQFFVDAFTGSEICSMQRFSKNNVTDKCLIVPSLVTENEASLSSSTDMHSSHP